MNLPATAWRNLWRNPRRTLLTLVAISFGLFLSIFATSAQDQGFADMIDTAARMGSGHVSIQHPEYLDTPTLTRTVRDGAAVIAIAEQDPDVQQAMPRITGQAMIATARNSYGAFFIGYDPTLETKQTLDFLDGVVDGESLSADSGNGVVLGDKLAANLGVELGDKVVYTMIDRSGEIIGALGRVRGIIDTGADSVDGALLLLPIDHLRKQLGYGESEVTRVALYLSDSRKSDAVAGRLGPKLADSGDALTWYEVTPDLSGFIAMKVGGARFMMGVILILVTASIFNTLFVSVLERSREFGVLLAIGYSPGQMFSLVMWESLFLAVSGVVIGGIPTYLAYRKLHATGIDLSAQLGDKPMEIAGVGMQLILPFGIYPEHVLVIVACIIGATLLAGLYPAWRAGSIQPVDAIKLV